MSKALYGPEDAFGVEMSVKSLQKRLKKLETELSEEAFASALSLLDYRIFSDSEQPIRMGAMGKALADFQLLFSVVLDAVKNGPKIRATVDAAIAELSAFNFECSYEGSAGLVFSIKQESQATLIESEISEAMDYVFAMANAANSQDITSFVKKLGAASVRKLYVWANDHAQAGIGADLQWQRSRAQVARTTIGVGQFINLKDSISATSDKKVEIIKTTGVLVGADVKLGTFHLTLPDNGDIHGSVGKEVSTVKLGQLSNTYSATIKKTTTVYFATERETCEYLLMDLQ